MSLSSKSSEIPSLPRKDSVLVTKVRESLHEIVDIYKRNLKVKGGEDPLPYSGTSRSAEEFSTKSSAAFSKAKQSLHSISPERDKQNSSKKSPQRTTPSPSSPNCKKKTKHKHGNH